MGWIILIVILIVIFYAKNSNKKQKSESVPEITFSVKTTVSRSSDDPTDTGKIKKLSGDSFCLNPKSPFPITLRGLSQDTAKGT